WRPPAPTLSGDRAKQAAAPRLRGSCVLQDSRNPRLRLPPSRAETLRSSSRLDYDIVHCCPARSRGIRRCVARLSAHLPPPIITTAFELRRCAFCITVSSMPYFRDPLPPWSIWERRLPPRGEGNVSGPA